MRDRKDRRKSVDATTLPIEDISQSTLERRKLRDRRIANLSAEERQLLLSEMPGISTDRTTRKD